MNNTLYGCYMLVIWTIHYMVVIC